MRVLIYIEPHPIRNSKTHFTDVARKLLPLLQGTSQDFDVRMYVTDAVISELGQDAVKPVTRRLIRSTKDEEDLITSYLCDWDQEGIPIWLDLMDGKGQVCKDYTKVLRRLWSVFPFDVVVYWGENGAIGSFVEERPITKIGIELGCTRPPFLDSLVMDPLGTNGAAAIPKLSVESLHDIVDGQVMSSHEALLAYSKSLETEPYAEQFKLLPLEISERLLRSQKVVFLPLQLYDDANLLRFSPYKTIADVVMDVVPKLAEHGYTILIKPHPAAKHRGNAVLANNIARAFLKPWANSIIWCDHPEIVKNTQLIRISDFVVTVNSSVGFEALYFDKPVVVLGDAIYKPKNLFPTLDQMLDASFDKKAYLEGIGYLRKFFLECYLQPLNTLSNPAAFFAQVSLIHALQQKNPGDPQGFVKGYWDSSSLTNKLLRQTAMFAGRSVPGQSEFGMPKPASSAGNAPAVFNKEENQNFTPYIDITRKLIDFSAAQDLATFSDWLWRKSEDAQGLEEIVIHSGMLDAEYYLKTYPDVLEARIDPLAHFARFGIVEGRTPRPEFSHEISLNNIIENIIGTGELLLSSDVFPVFPLEPEAESSRQMQLQELRSRLLVSPNRIAVVAHMFYRDLVPDILDKLAVIPESFDLIVTLPDWGACRIVEMVQKKYPQAIFYHAVNRGRDIGPFIDVLPALLEKKYDAVLKIQTKRGYFYAEKMLPEMGDLWREEMLNALLGSSERVASIIQVFRNDQSVNMVGASPYFLSLQKYKYFDGGRLASLLVEESVVDGFFAGTMFWVRPECLSTLAKAIEISHFAPETGSSDGALAHLVERIFGQAAGTAGGRLIGVSPDASEDLELAEILPSHQKSIHEYLQIQTRQSEAKKGELMW